MAQKRSKIFVSTLFGFLAALVNAYSNQAANVPMPPKNIVSILSKDRHVPDYMMKLYNVVSKNFIRFPLGADVIRSFSSAGHKKVGGLSVATFQIKIPRSETILYVMFQMCIEITKTSVGPFGIELTDIEREEIILRQMKDFGKQHCVKIPVANERKIQTRARGSEKVDMIFGFRIFTRFNTSREEEALQEMEGDLKPVVIVFSQHKHNHGGPRVVINRPTAPISFGKRSLELYVQKRPTCKRQSLVVNFGGLGYKSIIAPTIFDAKQCVGVCKFPLGLLSNPTQHSMIQQLLHSLYGRRIAKSTCCAAKRLAPLTIMVNDTFAGGIAIRSLEDMVVAECGCI